MLFSAKFVKFKIVWLRIKQKALQQLVIVYICSNHRILGHARLNFGKYFFFLIQTYLVPPTIPKLFNRKQNLHMLNIYMFKTQGSDHFNNLYVFQVLKIHTYQFDSRPTLPIVKLRQFLRYCACVNGGSTVQVPQVDAVGQGYTVHLQVEAFPRL